MKLVSSATNISATIAAGCKLKNLKHSAGTAPRPADTNNRKRPSQISRTSVFPVLAYFASSLPTLPFSIGRPASKVKTGPVEPTRPGRSGQSNPSTPIAKSRTVGCCLSRAALGDIRSTDDKTIIKATTASNQGITASILTCAPLQPSRQPSIGPIVEESLVL
jgi:hypothetical protein